MTTSLVLLRGVALSGLLLLPALAVLAGELPMTAAVVQPASQGPAEITVKPHKPQAQSRPLPMAALVTFALMASQGSSLPQNNGLGPNR